MLKKISRNEKLTFQPATEEDKARGILCRLSGIIGGSKESTRNGRKYNSELWEKAFNNDIVKELFANGGLPGELDHPADREQTDPTKIAIMMREMPKVDENGNLIATVDVIDTPCGQIAYQLAKYGFNFGISSRGTGDVYDDGNEELVDPDSYQLNAFDLVLIPAYKEARLNMNESVDTNKFNLRVALAESFKKANAADKKIMKETLKNIGKKLNESLFDDPDFEYDDAIGLNLEFDDGSKFTIVEHVSDLDMWKLEPKNDKARTMAEESEFGDGFVYMQINDLEKKLDNKECVITEGITRYSDVVPEEDRKYWYFTTHGIGPGSIPSDLKVLKTQEGKNRKGTEGVFVQLNGVLNTSELKKFDMTELSPENLEEDYLADPTDDDLKPVNDFILDNEFELEAKGKTLFGRIHYQLKKSLDHTVTEKDLRAVYEKLKELDEVLDAAEMPMTYSMGVHKDGDNIISLAMDVDKKYIRESYEDEENDGWGDDVEDILEDWFSRVSNIAYEVRNCVRGSYAIRGKKVEDLIRELNSIKEDLEDRISDLQYSARSINESQESEKDSKDISADKDSKEVVNDKSKEEIEAELKEALLQNSKLESDNLTLKEKLSVCDAKEITLNEELSKYKLAVASLSNTANKVRSLKESVADLEKSKQVLGGVIKTTRGKFKSLKESVDDTTSKKKEVEDKLTEANKKMEDLTKQLKELNTALDENKKLIESKEQTIKKYAKAYNSLKEKFVDTKAKAYGINKNELVEKLGKKYNVSDIDSVCESLSNYKANLNKLPFKLNENTKISTKTSKESITKSFNSTMEDDDISESLLSLANLN